MQKLKALNDWLKREERVVVAFSGGVDSTCLAYAAHKILSDNMMAVTGLSHSVPERDVDFVVRFSGSHGIRHEFIETGEFGVEEYLKNPENRCYYCKRDLFQKLASFAAAGNYKSVLDGTNISDLSGHRSGYKAIKEIPAVKMPFVELEITKEEIREISKIFGLSTAEKPASACLASRIPRGMRIVPSDLKMVDKAEEFLKSCGIKQVRVRHHGDVARIQVEKESFASIIRDREKIERGLKEIGYKYVTLDLTCYGA